MFEMYMYDLLHCMFVVDHWIWCQSQQALMVEVVVWLPVGLQAETLQRKLDKSQLPVDEASTTAIQFNSMIIIFNDFVINIYLCNIFFSKWIIIF